MFLIVLKLIAQSTCHQTAKVPFLSSHYEREKKIYVAVILTSHGAFFFFFYEE